MARLSKVRVDCDRADNGAWFEYEPGIRVKLARMGSPAYVAGIRDLELSKEELENFVESPKCMKLLAQTVIKDIEAEDDNDQPIVYTSEFGEELLNNPEYVDFKTFVIMKAGNNQNYRAQQVAADLGN